MKVFHFNKLLTEKGWIADPYVSVDPSGTIAAIDTKSPSDTSNLSSIAGMAIPGFHNAHSHAFQYAMAGLAEGLQPDHLFDDFWGWRTAMYDLALKLTPDQIRVIAAKLYGDMLARGYTSVAEFHYLHHDHQGTAYSNRAEIGQALLEAADQVGMQITLIPIFYQTGGFGEPATRRQRRFVSQTPEDYLRLLDETERAASQLPGAHVGIGFHSLRAVPIESIEAVLAAAPVGKPVHIHLSEQRKEVDECQHFYGARPLEVLAASVEDMGHFSLVHGTHFSERELRIAVKRGANIVLCPTTEGNLGDGIFPLPGYKAMGGRFSIGSDSHVCVCPTEELRLLEYCSRFLTRARSPLCDAMSLESGTVMYEEVQRGGQQATGRPPLRVGSSLDVIVLNNECPAFANASEDKVLSSLVFSPYGEKISCTITAGRIVAREGRHLCDQELSKEFGVVRSAIGA